jgi:hypothetical protein
MMACGWKKQLDGGLRLPYRKFCGARPESVCCFSGARPLHSITECIRAARNPFGEQGLMVFGQTHAKSLKIALSHGETQCRLAQIISTLTQEQLALAPCPFWYHEILDQKKNLSHSILRNIERL